LSIAAAARQSLVGADSQGMVAFGLNLRPPNGIGIAELLGFLLAGLLMGATVCMYPLIPIVTAVTYLEPHPEAVRG
jgi:thiol:disulfide interchange protein DsbD